MARRGPIGPGAPCRRVAPACPGARWRLRAGRPAAGADERGLPLLAADLRVSWAIATRDPSGLGAVLAVLERAPLARGRVRVIQAELGGQADLDAALDEVTADAPWFARGLRALGRRENDGTMIEDAAARIAGFLE